MKHLCGLVLLGWIAGGVAQGISLTGTWDLTLELLPTPRIYESNLTLELGFAPGWRLESESQIYSDGLLRYQNFYLSGSFGEWSAWGKVYFHAQERRYRKVWFHAELPLGGGVLRSSFHHWASAADYSSSDRDTFGAWPCLDVVSWSDAWKFMAREVYVTGPVASAASSGGNVYINLGLPFPDPDRFQIFIPASSVPALEAVFGDDFWATWNTTKPTVCVKGTIKGYRYTSGGPGGGGYSVAEVSLSSPSALSVGTCLGVLISPACPGTVVKWFSAKSSAGQTVYVQGPVASITGPGTYYGYPNHYRVRIGGGETVANRVEVILPSHPGWSTAGSSYTNEVCVHGRVTLQGGVAVVLPPDLVSTSGGPCCGGGLPGMFGNFRFRYTLSPWTVTADFGDCGTGLGFRQVRVEGSPLPLCCGLTYDLALAFTKAGLGSIAFTLNDLPLVCCGLTADLSVSFTADQKSVSFLPKWPGISGCLTVYGDVDYRSGVLTGFALHGIDLRCSVGSLDLRLLTAFDPDAVEDETDITFYRGEWEYAGLTYAGRGCCGGTVTFKIEFWWGNQGLLFGLQRFRFNLEVPLAGTITLFSKAQWDLSDPSPLDWFDVGWELSF
ncbi:MAG: hypothetical protein N2320_03330 [Candidatus Bipolaricaulota bacterium]|nr:hypothetical protein [Candidatus Bipolaricaulota bacterium]